MADETRAIFNITGPDSPQDEVIVTTVGIQVGRTADNDLTLPHAQVSRKHMRLYVDGDTVYATDLGSANGTFLNDAPGSDERNQALMCRMWISGRFLYCWP